jgi:phospholipase C
MPSSNRSSYQGLTPALPANAAARGASSFDASTPMLLGKGKIKHVVIIFQENRSPDNLFNGLPGADTRRFGLNSAGQHVKLQPSSIKAKFDVDHEHRAFEVEYDGGRMDGFNLERSNCSTHRCTDEAGRAYVYIPRSEVEPYFTMATQYVFADRMFQTNEGPSFPAHQYILSGTSTIRDGSSIRVSENPYAPNQELTGGCDSPKGSLVFLIDAGGAENDQAFPCFNRPALTDLVNAKSLSWRYYVGHIGPGLWNGPDAIRHIRFGGQYSKNVVAPPSQVLKDVAAGRLANVVWVTPTAAASDHAGNTNGSGPSWVASVVNAIGKSKYWNSTAIFLTWDDWGGWYDHVKPPQYNAYELGFRVPLVVISAYARANYVSHKQHEFGSILKFTEEAFGLGSLGTTDVRADDLSDCFNFARTPRKFKVIPAELPASYFLNLPPSNENPDDDF